MTEYATTPSAIEEWNTQRDRTAKWVKEIPGPQICYAPSQTPSQDSDFETRSLWDGSGWTVSDCESSTSIPPTMMLKYPDAREVLVPPSHTDGSKSTRSTGKGKDKSIGDPGPSSRNRSHTVGNATRAPTKVTTRPTTARTASAQPPPAHSVTHNGAQSPVRTVQGSKKSSVHPASVLEPPPSSAAPAPSIHSHQEHVTNPSSAATHANPSVPIEPSHRSRSASHSHSGSRPRSHSASHPDSQTRSQPSQPSSHAPSKQLSAVPIPASHSFSSRPPSHAVASSRHTSEAPPVSYEPPPISSIHSRSISHTDSRSSGPPEAITIHPPSANASHHSVSGSRAAYPATAGTSPSVPPVANVVLPPSNAESVSLSYRSIPRQHEAHQSVYVQPSLQSSRTSRYRPQPPTLSTKGVQVNRLSPQNVLPTPISIEEHRYTIHPGRAMSNMSAVGLDGGYVLIDGEDAPEEQYTRPKKGSFGSRSGHERGSLMSVFGGATSRFSHSRSRSAGQSTPAGATVTPLEPIPGSPVPQSSPLTHRSHHSEQLQSPGAHAYPTPISPSSHAPFSIHHDTAEGPHPPSIVYAPARHGRTTQFSPPRIMYMAASPRGAIEHSPARSMRRIRNGGEGSAGVRDSGWIEHQAVTGGPRTHGYGHSPVARDYTQSIDANFQAQATYSSDAAPITPASAIEHSMLSPPSRPKLAHSHSDATSTRTNIAGVGTHNAGRSHDRSRSSPRGIAFSASAPQPASMSAPHAAMMVPPTQERERGVRDTPYPTPPGSANEHLSPAALITAASQGKSSVRSPRNNRPVSVRSIPLYATSTPVYTAASTAPVTHESLPHDGKIGTKTLMSRFRDVYQAGDFIKGEPIAEEPRRGRARERRRRDDLASSMHKHVGTRRRAASVESEGSASSASTYYVISNPGQKVRIIRTDGTTVTQTTSVSRHASSGQAARNGWFRKAKAAALRPRFGSREVNADEHHHEDIRPPIREPEHGYGRMPSADSRATLKKQRPKFVDRNHRSSFGSSAVLSISREASANGEAAAVPVH